MDKTLEYQCSNCGKEEKTRVMVGIADGMYALNYRAVGDALYCPECVKTWADRNGKPFDEMFSEPRAMFLKWWHKQASEVYYRQ